MAARREQGRGWRRREAPKARHKRRARPPPSPPRRCRPGRPCSRPRPWQARSPGERAASSRVRDRRTSRRATAPDAAVWRRLRGSTSNLLRAAARADPVASHGLAARLIARMMLARTGIAACRAIAGAGEEASDHEPGRDRAGDEERRPAPREGFGIGHHLAEIPLAHGRREAIDPVRRLIGIARRHRLIFVLERIGGPAQRLGKAMHRLRHPILLLVKQGLRGLAHLVADPPGLALNRLACAIVSRAAALASSTVALACSLASAKLSPAPRLLEF